MDLLAGASRVDFVISIDGRLSVRFAVLFAAPFAVKFAVLSVLERDVMVDTLTGIVCLVCEGELADIVLSVLDELLGTLEDFSITEIVLDGAGLGRPGLAEPGVVELTVFCDDVVTVMVLGDEVVGFCDDVIDLSDDDVT